MKKYVFLIFLFIHFHTFSQTLEIGDQLPEFSVEVLNRDKETIGSEDLKGKVVLFDFWATWCSPCVAGMPHLQELQDEFKDKLAVITVSDEAKDKLEKFIAKKPYNFVYARDLGTLRSFFPFNSIPHSVLIAPNGTVSAITEPQNITKKVIETLIKGGTIDLPVKKDMSFELAKDYFQLDTTIKSSFIIQPYNPDIPSFSFSATKGPFKGRRITMLNAPISRMYKFAYDVGSPRVVQEGAEEYFIFENTQYRYNMDIVVENPDSLYAELKDKLNEVLPIKSKTAKKTMKVAVIKRIPNQPFPLKKTDHIGNTNSDGESYQSTGNTLEHFGKDLESRRVFDKPVVNDTDLNGFYEFDFTYMTDDLKSLKEELNKIGLDYAYEEREIDVLVLYEE